ncbi:Branched-chain amino acid aminotransferase [Colletotrichum higginsianum IMI 349063]|nr:Branched-chain amino acid aminotransferase [Colletotrichum higginsianum IMI 349063]OBR13051.1 Branched-chain amino acid aminotransferase [Colletotrichum higginsianum IMI 349063]
MLRPPEHIVFAVYVAPMASLYHGTSAVDALVLDDFDRAAPRGVGAGKLGGNYAPVWPYSTKAAEAGFPVTLHLYSATRSSVEEFSTSGFVGILTADGRREDIGWKVHREKVPFAGLDRFSRVFADQIQESAK